MIFFKDNNIYITKIPKIKINTCNTYTTYLSYDKISTIYINYIKGMYCKQLTVLNKTMNYILSLAQFNII